MFRLNYKNNQEHKIIQNILETDTERAKKQISVNRIQHLRCQRRGDLLEFSCIPSGRQKEGLVFGFEYFEDLERQLSYEVSAC
jgi:hypothetical protein